MGFYLGALVVLKLMGGPDSAVAGLAPAMVSGGVRGSGLCLSCTWPQPWCMAGCWCGTHHLRVGPLVAGLYRPHVANLSWWTIGTRLFDVAISRIVLVPLWDAPVASSVVAFLVPAVGLWLLVRGAQRAATFDTAYALLIGGGMFMLPVVWVHYFVMLVAGRRPALSLPGSARLAFRADQRGDSVRQRLGRADQCLFLSRLPLRQGRLERGGPAHHRCRARSSLRSCQWPSPAPCCGKWFGWSLLRRQSADMWDYFRLL